MEHWKPIDGTDGRLEISSLGRVKSNLRDGRILRTNPDPKGYLKVRVTLDRVKYSFKVHRMVAQAFIPNPDNLPQVNHKDGNKLNNSVDNLEWVSNRDNAHHAIANGLWKSFFAGAELENERRRQPVTAITKNGEHLHFKSVSEAERYFNSRHISDVLQGKRHHTAGCTFVRGVV